MNAAGADDEERKRGRKLPLFLLFLGPPGANLSACKIALRHLPGVELRDFTDPEAALKWADGKNVVAAVADDDGLPPNGAVAFLRHLRAWPGPRPQTILLSGAVGRRGLRRRLRRRVRRQIEPGLASASPERECNGAQQNKGPSRGGRAVLTIHDKIPIFGPHHTKIARLWRGPRPGEITAD